MIVLDHDAHWDELQNKADSHSDSEEGCIEYNLQSIVGKTSFDKARDRLRQIDAFPNQVRYQKELPISCDFRILCKARAIFDSTRQGWLEANLGAR